MKQQISRHWPSSNEKQWPLRYRTQMGWALPLPYLAALRVPRLRLRRGNEAEPGGLPELRTQFWDWGGSQDRAFSREDSNTERKIKICVHSMEYWSAYAYVRGEVTEGQRRTIWGRAELGAQTELGIWPDHTILKHIMTLTKRKLKVARDKRYITHWGTKTRWWQISYWKQSKQEDTQQHL